MSVMNHWRPNRHHRRPSATMVIALLGTVSVSGCGSASNHPAAKAQASVSAPSRSPTVTTTKTADTTTQSPAGGAATGALGYSRCMRANGVADFPDPSAGPGSGYKLSSGVVSSPAFQSAQAKCRRLVPGGAPGFQSNPSKRTMARLLRIATCMRAHDIHQFPDPRYRRPTHFTPGEYQEITDFDGATLLFPTTMNLQAPAYRQALSACGSPPLGLPH